MRNSMNWCFSLTIQARQDSLQVAAGRLRVQCRRKRGREKQRGVQGMLLAQKTSVERHERLRTATRRNASITLCLRTMVLGIVHCKLSVVALFGSSTVHVIGISCTIGVGGPLQTRGRRFPPALRRYLDRNLSRSPAYKPLASTFWKI